MFASKIYSVTGLAFLALNLIVTPGIGGEFQSSTVVLSNVKILLEKKSCPQCDLSGAELNRFDLSGANLEGADLTRAKMYLTNLSDANLRGADLQEAQFGGADLGGADLRGANLAGTSFAGAYMNGTLLEGEMVETTPYAADDISDVKQKVYIEDTAKSKSSSQPDTLVINIEDNKQKIADEKAITEENNVEKELMVEDDYQAAIAQVKVKEEVVQKKSVIPESKTLPAINNVLIKNEDATATSATSITVRAVKELDAEGESESAKEENVIAEEKDEIEKVFSKTVVEEPETRNVQSVEKAIAAPVLSEEVLMNLERLLDENKCYGCNLVGVNISGKNLDSADLEGADLTDAVLVGTDLEDANLKQVNLTNADLTGANLTAADMYKANLTNTNLSNAKLEGTLFDDAIMTNVKGYQQNMLLMGPVDEVKVSN